MAQKGKVYLFGDGNFRGNPMHGRDLAGFIVEKMDCMETELEVGGPDLLTQNQIAGEQLLIGSHQFRQLGASDLFLTFEEEFHVEG